LLVRHLGRSGLVPFDERVAKGLSANAILADLCRRLARIQGAFIITITVPRCGASAPPADSR